MSDVKREDRGSKGSFYIEKDGERAAELTFSRGGDTVILDHTEVGDSMRGTGAGKKLVLAAVEWARAEHVRILPLCPFAKSVFDKTPEIRDVLPG